MRRALATMACGLLFTGCHLGQAPLEPPEDFEGLVSTVESSADAIVLEGDGDTAVVVSPRLGGRILTATVGTVPSTGFVNFSAIAAGEVDPQFNNFGGIDRFWIGPEAGPYGLYFAPGAKFDRSVWKVPDSLDKGPYEVQHRKADRLTLARDMQVTNYRGVSFKVRVQREVGVLRSSSLGNELGIEELPPDVHYVGAYSLNRMVNTGDRKWDPEEGLIGIWVLGQFTASPAAVVIAPFEPGDDRGPIFNDDYFGKVSEVSPERIRVVGNTVCFKGDAARVGKFGLSQARTTGVAGAFDFGKNLLTVVKFTVPSTPERYGNSLWKMPQEDPYAGDVFQSYNNGVLGEPGEVPPEDFFELESTSPVRPLAPNESIEHRHATHHFQGPPEAMANLARELLGVDLEEVRKAMGLP